MVSAGGVTMANLPHVCRNFRRSSSSDSLIISDILYSPSNHSHLRAMNFKTLCEGIPFSLRSNKRNGAILRWMQLTSSLDQLAVGCIELASELLPSSQSYCA